MDETDLRRLLRRDADSIAFAPVDPAPLIATVRSRRQMAAGGVATAAVAIAAAVVTLLVRSPAAGNRAVLVPAATPGAQLRGEQELEHQISVRKQFGLDADPAYVESLQALPNLDLGYIGVPITPAEVAIMQSRNRAGLQLAAITSLLSRTEPDTFGGAWVEQQGTGIVAVASTRPATVDLAAVERLLPPGASAHVVPVALSYQDLERILNGVAADRAVAGVINTGYGIFPMENVVRLNMPSGTPKATIARLYTRFGHRGLVIDVGNPSLFQGRGMTTFKPKA